MTNANVLNAKSEIETYVLPSDAVVGGEWNLPNSFIDTYDEIKAPYWDFPYPEFTAYIKSVKETEKKGILLVEYYVYRLDKAHCDGYYSRWTTGKALVDVNTHRRWDVE